MQSENMKFVTKVLYPQYKVTPLLPSSSSKIPFENEALQFWKVFFNFGYYLLLIPFRFKWDRTTGVYILHQNSFQKICCLTSSLFGGLYYILKIRQKYTSATSGSRNPAMYFELAYFFCDTLYLLIMFGIFGRKGHEVARVFEQLQKSNRRWLPNPLGHLHTQLYAKVLCYLCMFTMILYLLEVHHDTWWSMGSLMLYFEADASVVFRVFGSWNSSMNGTLPVTPPPTAFTFLSLYSNSLERILNAFSDILFVMTVLMFRNLVKNFRNMLESGDINAEQALDHYRWLRDVTGNINHAMSLIIGSFIVGNLPFYATNVLDTFRDSCNIYMRLRYLFYCTYFFPALFLAAKSSKEVEEIKSWIYKKENHLQFDSKTLCVVLHEINGHTVGLSSFGCLTVNYGLFGSIVSIILTYALLKTQFQGPSATFPLQTLTFQQEKILS